MRLKALILAASALLCVGKLVMLAQSGEELFREARAKEQRDGDIAGAIQIYERIVRDFPSDRALVAQALFQLGECYERLRDPRRSVEYFQQITTQFQDQTETFKRASARLATAPRQAEGIFVASMDPQTGAIRQPVGSLTKDPTADESGATWSPDGQNLSFRRVIGIGGTQTLTYVRPIDGRSDRAIDRCPSGGTSFGHAAWLPDGKSLLYFFGGVGTTGCLGIFDGSTGRMIRQMPFPNMPATNWTTLSGDGTTLFAANPPKSGSRDAYVVAALDLSNLKTKTSFTLPSIENETTGGGQMITLSPDGRTLALVRLGNTQEASLVRFNIDGPDLQYRELVARVGQLQGIAWSKEGRRIVFAQSNDGQHWRLMQVAASGGSPPSFTGLEVTGLLRYFDLNRENTQIAFDGLSYTISSPGK